MSDYALRATVESGRGVGRARLQSVGFLSTRLSDLALVLIAALLVVSPMLESAGFSAFSYVDEAAAIVLVASGILARGARSSIADRVGVTCLIIVLCLGLMGNVLYNIQSSGFAVAVDAFTCLKMFAVFFAAKRLLAGRGALFDMLAFLGKLFVVAALVFLAVHLSGFMTLGGDRALLGIPSYKFFYGHPTELAAYLVGFSALFLLKRHDASWVVFCAILLVATQRSKAIAMGAALLAFVVYNQGSRAKKRPPLTVIVLIAVAVILLGMDQINFYYGDATSARTLITRRGFEIAGDLFPFGSGFATYGTYMSGEYYSPLYYQYGLSTVWGLMPGHVAFVSDCFWPAAVAQFGYIGFAALLVMIVSMFVSFNVDSKVKGIGFAARACIPLYLLILSTSDASFFNFFGPFYALILGVIANCPQERETSTCTASVVSNAPKRG